MNVFNVSSGDERSLNDQCEYLEDAYCIALKKQSLDERYNTYAVSFMKQWYERLLAEVLHTYLEPFNATNGENASFFNRIELIDATTFDLSSALAVFYKGGGNVSSSVKLHHRYELTLLVQISPHTKATLAGFSLQTESLTCSKGWEGGDGRSDANTKK